MSRGAWPGARRVAGGRGMATRYQHAPRHVVLGIAAWEVLDSSRGEFVPAKLIRTPDSPVRSRPLNRCPQPWASVSFFERARTYGVPHQVGTRDAHGGRSTSSYLEIRFITCSSREADPAGHPGGAQSHGRKRRETEIRGRPPKCVVQRKTSPDRPPSVLFSPPVH